MNDAETLLALQQIDLDFAKATDDVENLPQREQILNVRKKRAEVEDKATQVIALRDKANHAITKLQTEEEQLRARIDEEQKKVDESSDYKKTEALTREIEGLAKQLEKNEGDIIAQMEQLDKIDDVNKRIAETGEKLEAREAELIAQYKEQGGALLVKKKKLERQRDAYASQLQRDILVRYEASVKNHGGIGVSKLHNGHCSACGVEFAAGQVSELQEGQGISECPHCHRLLVIQ
ncbi:MAG: hypothetical protein LBM21_03730 [Coriobacteriales bacterium]|jgi:predicted  nucleic acid-binding Zn-ribbon protein|nr:hypothetical protein [Coriobacteriales bacterium]